MDTVGKKVLTVAACMALCGAVAAGLAGTERPAAFASTGEIEAVVQESGDRYFGDVYLDLYRVPADKMSVSNNGGGEIMRAFDGDFSTEWISEQDNDVAAPDGTPDFSNTVTVAFSEPVVIAAILYQSSARQTGYGYPVRMELSLGTDGGEPVVAGGSESTPTAGRVLFKLPAPVRAESAVFRFVDVNHAHKYAASAKEIVFLQPENEAMEKVVSGEIFTDYTRTELKAEYSDGAALDGLRSAAEGYVGTPAVFSEALDRAELVRQGRVVRDRRREFTTAENGENTLARYGDVRTYCSSVLKMSSFGVNYQPTGIAACAGSEIVVYVEADGSDPLPSILFTQTFNDWSGWSKQYNLVRGRNVFTVPDFVGTHEANYTVRPESGLTSGGAVYLQNPYTPDRQSESVKVYLEGGVFYPLFRKGGDEQKFLAEVEAYEEAMREEPSAYPDVAEIEADHVLLSSVVSSARTLFSENGGSPQRSAEQWDEYMEGLLGFAGVSMDPDDPDYDEIHPHLRHNCRIAQPWAGALAYAASGFCGFCAGEYGDPFSLLLYHTFGWAMPHELGHSFDNNQGNNAGRTIGEITNNMWAIWDLVWVQGLPSERFDLAPVLAMLAPDDSGARPFVDSESIRNSGYLFWWMIENRYPGFWGKMENVTRYRKIEEDFARAEVTEAERALLTREERHAYFCSLALHTDLGYYFDRWGFYFTSTDNAFRENGTSSAYRKLMEAARENGELTGEKLKFWYGDYRNYAYVRGEGESLYDGTQKPQIRAVYTTEGGHTLILPEETREGHLGYEVLEHGKVIGFTRTTAFTDPKNYANGYVPSYTVRAYDRYLNASDESEAVAPAAEENGKVVARIGTAEYRSLGAAVAAANAGDVVVLVSDLSTASVTVDRSITITCEGDVTVTRRGTGHLIYVADNVSLTIAGADGTNGAGTLTFDGDQFLQDGSLVAVGKQAHLYTRGSVVFCNNYTTGNGGGLLASSAGWLHLNGSVIRGNRASFGGGIANLGGSVAQYVTGCTVTGNTAKRGGGIYADGALTLNGGEIRNNTASEWGGGIALAAANTARKLTVNASSGSAPVVSGNRAAEGGALYVGTANSVAELNAFSSSENGEEGVFLRAGRLVYHGGECSFGEIVRLAGGSLLLKGAAPRTELRVRLDEAEEGAVVLSPADNFVLTEEMVASVVLSGEDVSAALADTGRIEVRRTRCTVTLLVEGEQRTVTAYRGEKFVLPAVLEGIEDRYAKQWRAADGTVYASGEEVPVSGDVSFEATLAKACALTFVYSPERRETVYLPDGAVYSLPSPSQAGKRLVCWRSEGEDFAPYTGWKAEGDRVFDAVFETLCRVTVEGTDHWREYGAAFTLPGEPAREEGYRFMGWKVGGTLCAAGERIVVRGDLSVTADRRLEHTVRTTVNGKTTEDKAVEGEPYVLPGEPKAPAGMKFAGWLVEGELYEAGASVSIEGDTNIVASFEQAAFGEGGDPAMIVGAVVLGVGCVLILSVFLGIRSKGKRKRR